MKEYIEREAAIDHLVGVTVIKYTPAFSLGMGAAAAEIQMLPAADVVEVVRCKDCDVPHNKWIGCRYLNGLIPPPDFYCAYGKRKIDKEE